MGKISAKPDLKKGWACKKYRNRAGMETCKKTNLLWNNSRKERQEHYPTSPA